MGMKKPKVGDRIRLNQNNRSEFVNQITFITSIDELPIRDVTRYWIKWEYEVWAERDGFEIISDPFELWR